MDAFVVAWYAWLSRLTQGTVFALGGWAERFDLPAVSAVAFGLIGATSPCQLTTNLGALAYVSAHPSRARPVALALAYAAGKVSVYTLVGAAVVLAGLQLQAASIPIALAARKALGPLMIVIGLGLLDVRRLNLGLGPRVALRLRQRLRGRGAGGAYLLGVAFSFAFCPTLFWLFFGSRSRWRCGARAGGSFRRSSPWARRCRLSSSRTSSRSGPARPRCWWEESGGCNDRSGRARR